MYTNNSYEDIIDGDVVMPVLCVILHTWLRHGYNYITLSD